MFGNFFFFFRNCPTRPLFFLYFLCLPWIEYTGKNFYTITVGLVNCLNNFPQINRVSVLCLNLICMDKIVNND